MKNAKLLALFFGLIFIAGCASTKIDTLAPFKGKTAQQILAGGEHSLNKGNYDDAINSFHALDALYPFTDQTKQAQLDAIYAHYKNDDYAGALTATDHYIHLYPRGKNTDYAYYMKGVVNYESSFNWLQKIYNSKVDLRDLTGFQAAFNSFNALVRGFPKSMYVKDAYKRMVYIRNTLAKHEVDIGKFYYKQKDYTSAIARAKYAINHYDGSPQVITALKLLAKSYDALGNKAKANEARYLLKTNFPTETISVKGHTPPPKTIAAKPPTVTPNVNATKTAIQNTTVGTPIKVATPKKVNVKPTKKNSTKSSVPVSIS